MTSLCRSTLVGVRCHLPLSTTQERVRQDHKADVPDPQQHQQRYREICILRLRLHVLPERHKEDHLHALFGLGPLYVHERRSYPASESNHRYVSLDTIECIGSNIKEAIQLCTTIMIYMNDLPNDQYHNEEYYLSSIQLPVLYSNDLFEEALCFLIKQTNNHPNPDHAAKVYPSVVPRVARDGNCFPLSSRSVC